MTSINWTAPFGGVWRFWVAPIRAEPLALFRILLGLMMLGNLLTGFARVLPEAAGGDNPLVPATARDGWLEGKSRICLLRGRGGLPFLDNWLPEDVLGRRVVGWVNAFTCFTGVPLEGWVGDEANARWKEWGAKSESAYFLFGLYLASLVLMTVGLATRRATLLVVLLAATFGNYLQMFCNGGDDLARNGLWLLVLSPAGATWSVDAWWRNQERLARGLPAENGPALIEPWSVRLMQIQVCCLYLFVGLSKLSDLHWQDGWLTGEWINGIALYWVMNDTQITRWSYAQFPMPVFLCRLLTWSTLVFEVGFPLFVLWRWTRIPLLVFGLMLHLGILATMEIGWFSQITLCWYVLFLSGDTVTAGARWALGLPAPRAEAAPAPV